MAQRQDLTIDQGSRFQWNYLVTGMSLVGLTARMQIRKRAGDSLLLFDASDYLSVDALNGIVTIDIPGSATEDQTWSRGVYDIEVYDESSTAVSPVRIAQGDVTLDGEVTI